MNEKKKYNFIIILLVIIIIILSVLCVLFATNTINFNYDNGNNNQLDASEKNKDKEENGDWVSYLLAAKNVRATLTRYYKDGFDGNSESLEETKVLSSEELKEYLNSLNKCSCHNIINATGFGGPTQYYVNISYVVNDINYTFKLSWGSEFILDNVLDNEVIDNYLVELLTESYPEEKLKYYDGEGHHTFSFDSDCSKGIIEKYFE